MSRTALLIVALAVLPAGAGAELVLDDGQHLAGTSVARKGDMYFLRLADGSDVPVASERVRQVRLGDQAPPDASSVPSPKPAEPPRAPGGLTAAAPVTLAGDPQAVRPPELSEQLRVMRHARSVFPRGPIDPGWTPANGWDTSLARTQFNPARWSRAPIDPLWRPTPAYSAASDVSAFNPARWFSAPIDARWRPSDGFRKPEP